MYVEHIDYKKSKHKSIDWEKVEEVNQEHIHLFLLFTMASSGLLFSYAWTFISWKWDLQANSVDDFGNWFAPSGAILVAAALVVEWRLKILFEFRPQFGHGIGSFQFNCKNRNQAMRVSKIALAIERLVLVSIILGTAIWAYGDKVVLCFAFS